MGAVDAVKVGGHRAARHRHIERESTDAAGASRLELGVLRI